MKHLTVWLKLLWGSLLAMLLLVAAAGPVQAFEIITGEDVGLEESRKVDGSLYIFGQKITINGAVSGDLICAGQDVEINGPVSGDIICAAQNLVLNGNVSGDIRVAGQLLTVAGPVVGNGHIGAQDLRLTGSGEIGRELAFLAESAVFDGRVAGDMLGTAGKVALNGQFGRQVNLELESLSLGSDADIRGDLVYRAPEAFSLNQDQVGGKIVPTLRPVDDEEDRETPQEWFWARLVAIVGFLFLGLVISQLRPHWLETSRDLLAANPLKTLAVGLLALVLWPLVMLLLVITIIGLPLSLIVFLGGVIVLVISRLIPALWLGQQLVLAFRPKPALWLTLGVGVPVAWLLFGTPLVGFGLNLLAVIAGTGAILLSLNNHVHHRA